MTENWEDLAEVENWEDEVPKEQHTLDSWDDEEEIAASTIAAATASKNAVKKKPSSADSIKKKETEQAKKKEAERNETEQERKIRVQREMEERDLKNAVDLFEGAAIKPRTEEKCKVSLDTFVPKTKEEFELLAVAVDEKWSDLQSNKNYPAFLESLIRHLVSTMNFSEVRHLSSILNIVANEKQKNSKDTKSSKKKATKKVAVKTENDELNVYNDALDDDYADFM